MTMVARPVGSLCTHGSILPRGQSAWALSPSLFGEVLRIMQKNCVGGVPVQASCHLEWSGSVSVLEMGDVFVCVSMRQYVLVCVVFVVLLVASVLASMRWQLCGGDSSKKKKRHL